ncbi:MAG: polysaccharide deacetylase family protein [Terriglobales bacterium]
MIASLTHKLPEPVWRAAGAWNRRAWPYCVVAFHRIAADGEELSYPAAAFADLCRYWRDHYEILTLDCLLARLAHGDAAPRPSLCITFDDGYADNAEIAAEILDRLDLSATFFITSAAIGNPNQFPWDRHLAAPPPLMRWEQVRALHAAGFGIGSHTATHARLNGLSADELASQLTSSRARLQAVLGTPVVDFAYPFGGLGDCDAASREAVRVAGYRCCFACHGGLIQVQDSRYRLNRVAVSPRWHATPRAWARSYAQQLFETSTTAMAFAYQ